MLPIRLVASPNATADDTASFTPVWTDQGRVAPLLGPLRAVVGTELPAMPGANVLGDARPGTVVLWTHPTRTTPSGAPMPVLAVGEEGDGRTIALGVDGGWRLEFSPLGARTAGRGHGALWDGLLGWLMRDPRFEPAQVEISPVCTAGLVSTLRAHLLPSSQNRAWETLTVEISKLDRPAKSAGTDAASPSVHRDVPRGGSGVTEVPLPPLAAGAYVARLRALGGGTTRHDFACEAGGDEWADSRPDAVRLRALAAASGGVFAWADADLGDIPFPKPTTVNAERHVAPVAPPWTWTFLATVCLGAHWITRRRGGLA